MRGRKVYLVRHGEPDLGDGKEKRFIGQIDLPLSNLGIEQSEKLAKSLQSAGIEQIYCSDLERTRKTAEIISSFCQVSVKRVPALREISLGQWEGKTFCEIQNRFPKEFAQRGMDIANFFPPGGESFSDCQQRVVGAFHEIIANSEGDVLIAAHAGVNRLILCYFLGMPILNLFCLRQDYCCLNLIFFEKGKVTVGLVNCTF